MALSSVHSSEKWRFTQWDTRTHALVRAFVRVRARARVCVDGRAGIVGREISVDKRRVRDVEGGQEMELLRGTWFFARSGAVPHHVFLHLLALSIWLLDSTFCACAWLAPIRGPCPSSLPSLLLPNRPTFLPRFLLAIRQAPAAVQRGPGVEARGGTGSVAVPNHYNL